MSHTSGKDKVLTTNQLRAVRRIWEAIQMRGYCRSQLFKDFQEVTPNMVKIKQEFMGVYFALETKEGISLDEIKTMEDVINYATHNY